MRMHDLCDVAGTAVAYFDSFSVQNFVQWVMLGEVAV